MQNNAMSYDRGAPALRESPVAPKPDGVDKYNLLTDLQVMARELGLKAAPLSVLAALLSFHPGRLIDESAIIFAGNAALSARLHGMPESTLRRHLAMLCAAGLVTRRDSPNRKRYARQAGDDRIAYGFSLAPLVQAAEMIATRAGELRLEDARLLLRRDALKARIARIEAIDETTSRLKRLARSAATEDRLTEIEAMLETLSPTDASTNKATPVESHLDTAARDMEMSANAAQNERHYKNDIQNITSSSDIASGSEARHGSDLMAKKQQKADISPRSFHQALKLCEPALTLAPIMPRSWHDLTVLAHDLAPSIGLTLPDWHNALSKLGAERTTLLVLSLVAKASRIAHLPSYARAAIAHASRQTAPRSH